MLGDLSDWTRTSSLATKGVLETVSTVFLVTSVLWAIAAWTVPAWRPAVGVATLSPLLWWASLSAARAGKVALSSWIVLGGLWLTLTVYSLLGNGSQSSPLAGCILLVMVAGLLVNTHAVVVSTFLALCSIAGVAIWGPLVPVAPGGEGDSAASPLSLLTYVFGAALVAESVVRELTRAEAAVANSRVEAEESADDASLAEERYREISELTSEYFYSLVRYPDGRFETEFVSPAFERITGFDASVFRPEDWWELIHPEDRGRMREREQSRSQGEDLDPVWEHRIVSASGEIRWLRDHSRWVEREDGVVRLYGAARDITDEIERKEEQRRLEVQLLQAQKMEAVGRLAGGVAHDFNNLLTVITGFTEILAECSQGDEEAAEASEQVTEAARRAAELTAQLLAFSRQSVHRQEWVDLRALLGRLEPMIARVLSETMSVELVLDPEPVPIRGDPSHLEQALLNLVVNARDANEGRGEIKLTAGTAELQDGECQDLAAGEYCYLEVQDHGRGMDEGTLEKIFEPFFSTKERGEGTGLGLSIAYGISRQIGGGIQMESEVGVGTTARIYIPRSPDDRREMVVPPPQGGRRPRRSAATIVVVEDELRVRELIGKLLEKAGHHVLLCALPSEALSIFCSYEGNIDLLVSDVVMPEVDGPELIGHLKKIRDGVEYLLISGNPNFSAVARRELPADIAFLQKPFKPVELLDEIENILFE